MQREIKNLDAEEFDAVIIGGGITGACFAHDAALRGLRVLLIEKNDFGSCTSSASSKLLHGGIRYLPKAQFCKVRESARERSIFQRLAPHLTSYVPFLIPTIRGDLMKGKYAMQAGMLMYNLICIGIDNLVKDPAKKIPCGKFIGKDATLKQVPLLREIKWLNGAQILYEAHMHNSERMTLSFIKTAVSNGAKVLNYVAAEGFVQGDNQVRGVHCKDLLTGTEFSIHARCVVNAAGPFLPGLNCKITSLRLHRQPKGFSKGVHVVTDKIHDYYALAMSSGKRTEGFVSRGGRHFFIIPWRNCSLIGTTNVPHTGDLENIAVTRKDLVDFIEDINTLLPGLSLSLDDVKFAFAGLYPLVSDEIKPDTYQGTGEYQLVDHKEKDDVAGIISVMGAKYTTARILAEKGVDLLLHKLDYSNRSCTTRTVQLCEGTITDLASFTAQKIIQYQDVLPEKTLRELIKNHGSEIDTICSMAAEGSFFFDRVCPDRETLMVEVEYAVTNEMAQTLCDVIFRRTGLGTIGHPGKKAVENVAKVMASLLEWSDERLFQEIEEVNRTYCYD